MKKLFVILFMLLSISSFSQETDSLKLAEETFNAVFSVVEKMPRYKGCENMNEEEAYNCTMLQIQKYSMTMPHPSEYGTTCFEGKIYLSFIVDVDGNIIDVKVLRGFDKLYDKAATEFIKKMPKFSMPGYLNNKAVKVKYNIPINITLG